MDSKVLLEKKATLKEEALKMITKGKEEIRHFTEDEVKAFNEIKQKIEGINEELRKLEVALPTELEKITNKEIKKMNKEFSLLKAIRNVANNKPQDELTQAVLDAGNEEMRKSGINAVGSIVLPSKEFRTVTVTTEGVDTVATDLMDVLEPLKAKTVLGGAKWLTGLTGDVQYPVMSAINASWEGETATTSASTPTFTQVKLSPKRLSVVVPISKQFLIQDSCGAEQAIRNEIINAVRDKLEATVLGSANGSTTQPAGLFYNGGSDLDTLSNFADICTLEATLETNNFGGNMTYIMSPSAKGILRGMAKTGTANGLVWENNEVDGTPALTTSNVASTYVLYGNLDNLCIANWGTTDITVDTFTLSADGCIRLVVNTYWDVKTLRNGAFAVAKL